MAEKWAKGQNYKSGQIAKRRNMDVEEVSRMSSEFYEKTGEANGAD